MKQKIILISALILLLALVGYMVKDLFFSKPDNTNPYAYNLDALKKADSTQVAFTEVQQVRPRLSEIHGIATDGKGRIYVAGKDSVEIFDQTGKPESIFRIGGTALCIHLDAKGNILLGMQDHIEKYDVKGKKLSTWKSCGPDAVLTSIAASGKNVFVADAGQKIVYRFDDSGNLLNKIGQKDPAVGVPGFIIPSPYFDLSIDKDGFLWVVNPGRHSLEKYDFDGMLISTWAKASMDVTGFCGCCNPSNIALLSDGSFVTSEKAIERVKIYKSNGDFVCLVAAPDSFIEGTKGLDLAIGIQGEILVLDPVKMLVRVFKEKKAHS